MTLALMTLWLGMAATQPPDAAYRAEVEAWRAGRVERLKADDGWLSVVGLSWLDDGDNTVGSASGNRVVLPGAAPTRAGVIALADRRLTFRAEAPVRIGGQDVAPGTSRPLMSDADGDPTVLETGSVRFYVIERDGRFAVRVKDSASEARRSFHGILYFPIDPRWRIVARFEPYSPIKSISVPNVLGHFDAEPSPGALVFEIGGKTYRLDPVLERGETDYFVIFGDRTNGRETYGAGRFLYISPPVDGKTIIDFNKAYNPPCVFTSFATCPLPPPQNKLPVPVEAGEKEYAH